MTTHELLPWEEGYAPVFRAVALVADSAAPSVASVVEHAVEEALRNNITSADADTIKGIAENAVQSVLDELMSKTSSAIPTPPAVTDFTKADARSRALQTLLIGLGLSSVAGVITAVGTVAHLSWAQGPQSLTSVVTLVVGSAVTAACNYLTRMTREPVHTATLCEHTPGGPPYPHAG